MYSSHPYEGIVSRCHLDKQIVMGMYANKSISSININEVTQIGHLPAPGILNHLLLAKCHDETSVVYICFQSFRADLV